MKFFALLFFFFSLMVSHQSTAQNVRVNMIAGSEAAQVQTYPGPDRTSDWNISHVNDGTFTIHNHSITINNVYGFDFSPDNRHVAVLEMRQDDAFDVKIYNHQGEMVAIYAGLTDINPKDPSLKLYLLSNGAIVLRDNITDFALYNQRDIFVKRVSNSSGSPQGETISRLAVSANGVHTFLYNPRILRGEAFASRIMRLSPEGHLEMIFYDADHEILHLTATNDGDFLMAILGKGDDQKLVKLTNDGEIVAEREAPYPNAGYFVQPEFNTITWFGNNNVQVYEIDTNERLALGSLTRQIIIFAMFDPDDNVVVTLTGRRNFQQRSMRINGVRVIDLNARRVINSRDLDLVSVYSEDVAPEIVKTARNEYKMTGVTNALRINIDR